ncbi:MAG: trypsin-like serine protease [Anaerolineae bacterium]|nr:trypsin-like serine protease [Anaerolineae bacterium]
MFKKFMPLVVLALLLTAVTGAWAITGGEPDGERHPYVGLIVFDVNGVPAWRCSGTLIARDLVLTAGHCTAGATGARVWFGSDLTANPEYPYGGDTSYEGVPIQNPIYGLSFPNTGDVGLVRLTEQIKHKDFPGTATIAPLGYLDGFATRRGQQDTQFRAVGYGRQAVVPEPQSVRVRYTTLSRLVNLRNALTDGYNLQLGEDAGGGNNYGGTCFGDSGGPIFHPEDSNQIVAVVSFGLNSNCVGVGFHYRVDTQAAYDFVMPYLNSRGR